MSFDLKAFLTEERRQTEVALDRCLETARGLPGWAEPVLRHGVLTGGKRIRPILCLTAYRSIQPRADMVDRVRRLACSLELIHAYSLMHDDLPCMDDAPLRRGQPTPHTVYGEPTTMRAAAMLIPMAAQVAWTAARDLHHDARTAAEVVRTLMNGAGASGMVGGQWTDLASEGLAIGEDDLTRLHRMKTGALLTAALRMGGLAAGAEPAQLRALESYGRSVGLAFQIADDVLDRTASTEELGKKPSDVEMAKSTYVGLLGVAGARARGQTEIERALRALADGGIESAALSALASYILERER